MLSRKNIIDSGDLSLEELGELLNLAEDMIENEGRYSKRCEGKILASLFYEPSTRTRLSFEAAMLKLGGQNIGFSEPGSSSVTKGENIADTIRVISAYADIAVMRHPKEGAPKYASEYSEIPIINAGDGGHQHPTQTLADVLTIKRSKGRLNNLNIGFCGDLKFGRTVHSLIKTMVRYEDIKLTLISPDELKVPEYIKESILRDREIDYVEVNKLEDIIGGLDVLYMTRVQKERFFNEADYIRLKNSYILDLDKLEDAREDLAILHPLPRVNEIPREVDGDPRAWYFKQVEYGMYMRMALIARILGDE